MVNHVVLRCVIDVIINQIILLYSSAYHPQPPTTMTSYLMQPLAHRDVVTFDARFVGAFQHISYLIIITFHVTYPQSVS